MSVQKSASFGVYTARSLEKALRCLAAEGQRRGGDNIHGVKTSMFLLT